MSVSAFPYGVFVPPAGSGVTVTADTSDESAVAFNETCFAGISFNTDGQEYHRDTNPGTNWTFDTRTGWLDSGSSSDVWIERTVNSGSLNDTDPGSGRLQLNTTRNYGNSRPNPGTATVNITFDFYDAASGGSLLDTVTLDINATRTNL